MALTRLPGFIIDSTSSFTFAQANVTGNLVAPNISSNNNVNFVGASNVSLGAVGNIKITGGTSGYVLQTDGTGNLSWVAQSAGGSSNIANGNSNVNIATSGGNVTTSVGGNANILVVTSTGINVSGTINSTGDLTAGNVTTGSGSGGSITGGNLVSANYLSGTLTTTAQPNVTSIGALTGLTSTGTINFVNASNVSLGAIGNVKITGGATGQYLTTDGSGNLSFTTLSVSSSSISNGNSNVNIPAANGNVNISSAGNANVVVVTGTGINVAGTLNVTGVSNLGPASNVKITGGSSGQYLTTDGAGTLSWGSVSTGSQPGTDFNTSINTVNNYAVTNTMANGAVFGSNVIVYSMYITNIDATGSNGAAISANLRYANGTSVILVNQIPVPYRGAVELFKQPKYFANGDAIQFQAFNNGVAANSFFHASTTYQTTTDTAYQYAVTNIASADTATDTYTSTGNASVVQSVMITNSSNLGNIAVTTSIVNSSNVVQGYLSYTLLVPINSTIELCEQPRRMESGDKIRVTAGAANTITVTVAAKKI